MPNAAAPAVSSPAGPRTGLNSKPVRAAPSVAPWSRASLTCDSTIAAAAASTSAAESSRTRRPHSLAPAPIARMASSSSARGAPAPAATTCCTTRLLGRCADDPTCSIPESIEVGVCPAVRGRSKAGTRADLRRRPIQRSPPESPPSRSTARPQRDRQCQSPSPTSANHSGHSSEGW